MEESLPYLEERSLREERKTGTKSKNEAHVLEEQEGGKCGWSGVIREGGSGDFQVCV